MRPFIFLSILSILFLSPVPSAAQTRSAEDLIGSWEWVSTRISADHIVTPETEGYTRTLVLSAEGMAYWYQDGVLTEAIPFEASGGNSGGITFQGQTTWSYSFGLDGEDLLLNESQTAAGPYHLYGRAVPVAAHPETWGGLKTRFGQP